MSLVHQGGCWTQEQHTIGDKSPFCLSAYRAATLMLDIQTFLTGLSSHKNLMTISYELYIWTQLLRWQIFQSGKDIQKAHYFQLKKKIMKYMARADKNYCFQLLMKKSISVLLCACNTIFKQY